MKYKMDYYYLAQGMEGHAEEVDHGIIEANSKAEAKEVIVMSEVPEDRNYGPDNAWSVREWVRSCLSAKIMLDGENVTTKEDWFKILLEIINGEWVKVNEKGDLKYRSGMDAGSPPPPWFDMNLNDIIKECKISRW